jgi:hypothetical protein
MGRASKFFNRVSVAILMAALVIGASQVHFGPKVFDIPIFGALMFFAALFFGMWLLLGLLRSGGL